MKLPGNGEGIIALAFGMAAAVGRFAEQARKFYYTVMLSGHACPKCGASLEMADEGLCRCMECAYECDPTVAFQRCGACGGEPRLQIRRYQCAACGGDVRSRFLFDGLVFDAEYFRQKMAEHRERKAELRERVRQMLAESRSSTIEAPAAELETVPGLVEVLNSLTLGFAVSFAWSPPEGFDLQRYQAHVQAHIGPTPVSMEIVPRLSGNARLDRIWRFIAIIFLAHAGLIDVWQEGPAIMVKQREIDTEGSRVPGCLEEADGIA